MKSELTERRSLGALNSVRLTSQNRVQEHINYALGGMLHTAYVSVSIQVSNTPFYLLTVTYYYECHSSVIKVSLNQAITVEASPAPLLPSHG